MNTSWVWDFISDIAFPGIGLGLLGLIIWNGLAYFFRWLICRYCEENDKKSEGNGE